MIDTPALDTWLARLLLERQRFEVGVLQDLLAEVRAQREAGGPTLARSLVVRGLLPEQEALGYLGQLASSPAVNPSSGSARRTASGRLGALADWQPGSRVGDYVLLEQLGTGGMGAVFLAEHAATGGRYAIKTLLAGADPDMMTRFQREAEAQAAVDGHPNVVRVHAAGSDQGRLYLVMDLAAGGDLQQRLRERLMSAEEGAALVAALARGLHHAHRHGVLHRDLKPANVMFDEAGNPKLVDFGLARVAWQSQALTKTGEIMGTPAYMAPEQAQGDRDAIDARSDVYGLGAILYEVLTGKPPFVGRSIMHLLMEVIEKPPERPSSSRQGIPPAIEQACLRALSKRSEERQQTALALAEELEAALRGEGRTARGSRGAWVALALALCALLGGALLAAFRPSSKPAAAPAGTAPIASPASVNPEQPAQEATRFVEPASSFPDGPHRANPEWCSYGSRVSLPIFESPHEGGPGGVCPSDLTLLLERAESGDVGGMLELGEELKERGEKQVLRTASPMNFSRMALFWFLRARAGGNWRGSYEASRLYFRADSLKDRYLAVRLVAEFVAREELSASERKKTLVATGEALRLGSGRLYPDPVRALEWYEELRRVPGIRAMGSVRLATLLLARDHPEDYERARSLLEMRANGAEALVRRGEMALYGKGEPRSVEKAKGLFLQAATKTNGRKPHRLGMLRLAALLRGQGQSREAKSWFEKATIESDDVSASWFRDDAHFALYHLHMSGELGFVDRGRAWDHLESAMHLRHMGAWRIWYQRRRWETGDASHGWTRFGSEEPLPDLNLSANTSLGPGPYSSTDPKEQSKVSAAWSQLQRDGNADAMLRMGEVLKRAKGIRRCEELAVQWFLRARELNPRGSYSAACLLLDGHDMGDGHDPFAAAVLFTDAARRSNSDACVALAEMLSRGQGRLDPDAVRAMGWYERALVLEPGQVQATIGLAALLLERGDPKDLRRAREMFESVRNAKNGGEAVARLGDMARDGLGVPRDEQEAMRLYVDASQGSGAREPHGLGQLRQGELLRARGETERAAELFTAARHPDWVRSLAGYQLYLMHEAGEAGAPDETLAKGHLETALKLVPEARRANEFLGLGEAEEEE